jgi:DNA mismatch repair protein MutS
MTLTPMMAQYMEIKAANSDCLLFYRMGDFYELFFEDAVTASKILGITLTKRGKHLDQDIPMAGVPVHAADDYLQKLIASGLRIAVCEQMEDPKEAKKRGSKAVVRRDVVRLVTPGTITEDNLLDSRQANWLVAVLPGISQDQDVALAYADISTGAFHVGLIPFSKLEPELARLEAAEILIPDQMENTFFSAGSTLGIWKDRTTPLARAFFDGITAEQKLCDYFNVQSLDAFGQFDRQECRVMAALVAYIERTQVGRKAPLERPKRDETGATLLIDAATRASLDILKSRSGEAKSTLFETIDRTVTAAGGRLLASYLSAPLTDVARIQGRLDAVEFFLANPPLRSDLRKALKETPDVLRALSRLVLGRGGPRDLGFVGTGLRQAGKLLEVLNKASEPLVHEIAKAKDALDRAPYALKGILENALKGELPVYVRDGGFIRKGYHDALDEACALRDDTRHVIAGLQKTYQDETGVKSLKIKHNNVLGYFIEVTALNSERLGASEGRFHHRQTLANAMRFSTSELAELEAKIASAAQRATALELEIFETLVAQVTEAENAIRAVSDAIAVLDVASSLAELAEAEHYHRPQLDNSLALDITQGRHPVVETMLRRQDSSGFVANDCDLGPPEGSDYGAVKLVTGPNMGGKSTYLRQNALIVILAQAGCFVPAASAHIGIVDRLFSRVGAADDIARGRSTFMVEMVETAAILHQAGEKSLVILDEIGRGTATYDGLSIAWACVENLHEVNRCRALFATHYHELTALSEKLARVGNLTMRVKEWRGDVVFLHEVASGAADRSYGLQVARLAGLPSTVIERAKHVLERLESRREHANASAGPVRDTLLDDLPLFQALVEQKTVASGEKTSTTHHPVLDTLSNIDPDALSPREALEALYRLKANL